jgi:uncharacterized membrane protein YphA (DoxX/SURF4 family)
VNHRSSDECGRRFETSSSCLAVATSRSIQSGAARPDSRSFTLAWGVIIAELVVGLLLIVGLWRKPTAVLAALLTLSFALSMTVVLGPHEPLNYSVFAFAFASLYLGLSQDVE